MKYSRDMKALLSRISLVIVGCMIVLSCSKQDVKDVGKDMVDVRLALSVSGTAYTKDVDDADATLDYTTDNQNKINDLYILLVDKDGKFQYLVEELFAQDNSNTVSKGIIPRPAAGSRLVLMANLNQQNLSATSDIRTWLNGFKGQDVETIYNYAVFSNTSGVWSLSSRSIPMWGEVEVGTQAGGELNLSCDMYKALAKINIWVNEKKGIEGFEINRVVVKNSLDKGYCVSQSYLSSDISVQYGNPHIPANAVNRVLDAEYGNLSVTTAFSDEIYVVEQDNSAEDMDPVTVEVHYTYNGAAGVGIINFKDEKGNAFDVIRNHSYIFNISRVSGVETNVSLIYDVVDYYDIHKINLGFN